jgi:hypothetical protein
VTTTAGQSLLVGRLHTDPHLARQAAFALLALVFLEGMGYDLTPRITNGLSPAGPSAAQPGAAAAGPSAAQPGAAAAGAGRRETVRALQESNSCLLPEFAAPARRALLDDLDPTASMEWTGWVRAQRLEREPALVAYELGVLTLGVELPPVLVRSLRDAPVAPASRVVELPGGAGYAAALLAALHPRWNPAGHLTLLVGEGEAAQLAAWAQLLLTRQLTPAPGSLVRVTPDSPRPFVAEAVDLALAYNLPPWLARDPSVAAVVQARQVLWV